jgi:GNAT superfamily N-acetyltransferase
MVNMTPGDRIMPSPLRPLLPTDLPQAHGLTQAVRWPHREQDWRFALDLGQGWAVSEGDRLLGTAISWPLGPAWGCFGMLIVAPDQQGRGLGARLMEAALAALGDRAVQLHATQAGQALYLRLGFTPAGLIHQHQGIAQPPPPAPLAPGQHLRPATVHDLPTLAALDSAATGMDRTRALAAILAQGQAILLERNGAPEGFAMLRPFGRGEVIGPVAAPDAAGAWALIAHFLSARAGAFLRIDITNPALAPLLTAHGLPAVDEALRMVRGTPPTPGTTRSYALVNQALG